MRQLELLFALVLLAVAALPAATPPATMDLRRCLQAALERNPSLRAAEQRWRAADHSGASAGAALGPSLALHDTYNRTNRQFNPFFVFPKVSHQVYAELRQSVYSGGKLQASERQARQEAERARWEFVEARQGLVESVIRSYLDWLQQREVNDYYRSAIERDRKLESEIAVRVQAGKALDAERLQAHIRVLDDRRKLLEGENKAELARSLLLVQMDLPPQTILEPVMNLSLLESIPPPSPSSVVLGTGNAALRATSAAVGAARAGFEKARGESRPTLDLAVRQSHVIDGLSFTSFDADYTEYVAVVDFPLFDGGLRREQKEAAKATVRASREEYENQLRQKELELKKAHLDLAEALDRVKIARDKHESAAENLRVARERYDAGTVLLSETLDAVANVELASTEDIASRFDVYRAQVAILRLEGRMYESLGK
ncbi:MAG: TolC family protein [Candidatus Wallbacteria bacterium]|nr:TolC family protein [Candidatus Wallbacteria bacterium]